MDQYALYYDLLYANRDVKREVDFIESIIQRFSYVKVKKILDVGCGTGIHSIELGRRGYNVLGIDISEEMIKRAREKAKGMENVGFLVGDASNIVFNERFDAAIAMYGVTSYFTDDEALIKFLNSIRHSLVKGGLFIFDTWNVFGVSDKRVYYEMPSPEFRKSGNILAIKESTWTIDLMNQLADVDISWSIVDLSKGSVDVFNHRIKLRLFTPREIKYILRDCGFQLCDIYPDYNQAPFSEGSPEMVVVVRAE
ncbi:MAG: class I SAM-dependent DNA methyltransferase [Candidatus Methanodesulfokora sp.]